MISYDSDLPEALQAIARAVGSEADGRKLKRELAKRIRGVMEPARQKVIARLLALPSQGRSGISMRQAIARQTRASVRFKGRDTGVSLVQRARGMPRDFQYAGRAFNRPEGWNVTTLGGAQVVQQMRPVEWFDQPIQDFVPTEARMEVWLALEDTARRIARETDRRK